MSMKEKKICSVDGCNKLAKYKGMCGVHYHRTWKYGDPFFRTTNDNSGICLHEGCKKKAHSLGYCEKHYQRVKHHGSSKILKIESHGMRKCPEYKVWSEMKQRCYNRNKERYPRYGGRGITVCDRWRNSFTALYEDMGPRPTSKHQLDRIDNDGNYEPGNCRWVTQLENSRNKSSTKMSTKKAKEIRELYKTNNISQRELANLYNIDQSSVWKIIHNESWV